MFSLFYDTECTGRESFPINQGLQVYKSLHIIIINNVHINRNEMEAEALINTVYMKGPVERIYQTMTLVMASVLTMKAFDIQTLKKISQISKCTDMHVFIRSEANSYR